MHYEYAIEPNSLTGDFKTFKFIADKFGCHCGRLISEFPTKWKRKVNSIVKQPNSGFSDMQIKIVSKFLQNDKNFVTFLGSFPDDESWINSAVKAHKIKSFRAIIATENTHGYDYIIPIDTLWEKDHPLFIVPFECSMPKTEQGFFDATKLLLNHAQHVLFIDPLFRNVRFYKTLKLMLEQVHPSCANIRYISKVSPQGENPSYRIDELKRELPQYIPTGTKIEIILLNKQTNFGNHNRFVLTEKGGIKFPWGLDLLDNYIDTINLMDVKTHEDKFNEFNEIDENIIAEKFSIPE